jgi:hypothetical protein
MKRQRFRKIPGVKVFSFNRSFSKISITFVLSILLILTSGFYFFLTHAAGNTYYISPTGNDSSGDGSQGNPWKSLNKAFNSGSISAGDIVYLRGGTYLPTTKNDFLVSNVHGTSSQYIRIEAYSGESPIIDSSNVTDFSSVSDAVLRFSSSSYINVSGIKLVGGNSITGVQSRGLQISSSNSYINVSDFEVTDTYLKGVGLSGQHLIFENSEVYNTSRDNVNRILENVTGWEQAVSTYTGADDIVIRNNYIHENWGEGIDIILGQNVLIEKNILHDNYGTNIYIDTGKNVQIRKNYIYHQNSNFNRSGLPSDSIKMANENSDATMYINNIEISNNILAIGNKRGVSYFQQNGIYSNVKIYNNVIYSPVQSAIWFENTSTTSGNEIKNNIIFDGSDSGYAIIDIDSTDRSGWVFVNNSWQNEAAPIWAVSAGDRNINPQFIGPIDIPAIINKPYYPLSEALGFKLDSSSPLRDTGTTSTAVSDDYEGTSRDSYPDIGPFEYISTPTPTPTMTPTICLSFTYSDWSACVGGMKTRVIIEALPSGCQGGNPILSETCQGLEECGPIDVNDDTFLTLIDLAAFVKMYTNTCQDTLSLNTCGSKDTNHDGVITLIDLASLAKRYSPNSCIL